MFYCFVYVSMSVVIQPSWLPNPVKRLTRQHG